MKLYFLGYFLIISFFSFIIMGIDKSKAVSKKRRINEAALMFCSLIGGSFGMYIGMTVFKHKTQKNLFVFGIPMIFALQSFIIYCVFF